MERLKAKGYLKNKKQSALWFSACRLLLFANYKTGNRYNHAPRCGTLWHGRASSVLRPAQSGAQVGIGQKCRTVDNQIGNAFSSPASPVSRVKPDLLRYVVNSITSC